jgi:DNA-binding Lrp family transcriptional regulator
MPLSDFEKKVVLALRRDPRAPNTELAAAVGAEERTVSRTITRLQESGLLVVSSIVLHENAAGWLVAQLELNCRPGTFDAVARALAVRSDTRFVAVTTGSADVVADLVVPDTATLHHVLNNEIGALDGVLSIRTHLVVRLLFTASDWDPEGHRTERRALAEAGRENLDKRTMDETDLQIAEVLGKDPRAALAQIAQQVGVHQSTVQRRLKHLLSAGYLAIRADVPPAALGYPVETRFSMSVRPAALTEALRTLSNEPTLRALYAITGPNNILGYSVHRSVSELQSLWSGTFADVRELIGTDLSIVLHVHKRSGTTNSDTAH